MPANQLWDRLYLTIESKGFRVYYNNSRHTISNQKEANYYYLAWK